MAKQEEFSARLDELGVVRWDTAPPEQGVIRFSDADGKVVAHGRYAVILSYGPGDRYTMGWDIGAYRAVGIPFVGRDVANEPALVLQTSRDEAWKRGLEVNNTLGADFIYWCATLLVAVRDFTEGHAPGATPDLGEGIANALAASTAPAKLPEDMSGPEKKATYGELAQLGLRSEVLESLVFVLEGDDAEVEASRDLVTANDMPLLISAYWKLPAWKQRTYFVQMIQDQDAPELGPIWENILEAPDDGPETARHGAKAIALARLDGDMSQYESYLFDYDRMQRETKRRIFKRG